MAWSRMDGRPIWFTDRNDFDLLVTTTDLGVSYRWCITTKATQRFPAADIANGTCGSLEKAKKAAGSYITSGMAAKKLKQLRK